MEKDIKDSLDQRITVHSNRSKHINWSGFYQGSDDFEKEQFPSKSFPDFNQINEMDYDQHIYNQITVIGLDNT